MSPSIPQALLPDHVVTVANEQVLRSLRRPLADLEDVEKSSAECLRISLLASHPSEPWMKLDDGPCTFRRHGGSQLHARQLQICRALLSQTPELTFDHYDPSALSFHPALARNFDSIRL